MRCICLLLCISGVVRVHADISVKKLLYVEATVDAKDAVSGERLSKTLEELKKALCLPGEECQDKKSHQGTTYRPYYYPSRRPWYTTTYRPYYSHNTTRRYWNWTTYRPYDTTTSRHSNATRTFNTTYSTPYDYIPGRFLNDSTNNYTNESDGMASTNETWTIDYFDEEEKALFDCSDLPAFSPNGLYNISAEGGQVEVFCDMETDDGNWTVMQSHNIFSQLNMNNSWDEYRDGFGKTKEAFWLGNKQISDMTTRRLYSLRIDMDDITGASFFAKYKLFAVGPEDENFRLHVQNYSGNAGDGLVYHDRRPFSTYDMDNDYGGLQNCPQKYGGGWWYRSCFLADLNRVDPLWLNKRLVATEMKIRPAEL